MGFFFLSCNSSSWMVTIVSDDHLKQKASSLTYVSEDGFSLFELEFYHLDDQIFAYIHSSDLKNTPQHSTIPINLQIGQNEYCFSSHLHEGQERICLPSACTHKMIEALKNKNPLVLSILEMHETIETQDFERKFEKFMNQNQLFDTMLDIYEKILEEPS